MSKKSGYEDCVIGIHNGSSSYNRYFHKEQYDLCGALGRQYGVSGNNVAIFPSGMCAIDSVFQVLMMENNWGEVNIVYGDELYCDTPRTIKYLSSHYVKTNLYKINSSDGNFIGNSFRLFDNKIPTILFIEACSNPNGNVFDFELLESMPKIMAPGVPMRIIVDNTWLSSAIFNPFNFDKLGKIDVVVNSLTKYYGAGRSGIMGAAIARDKTFGDRLLEYAKVKGLHVSPLYCKEAFESLKTLKKRIATSSRLTDEITQYLESEKGLAVSHPKLQSHPCYRRARAYFGNLGPSVFTFVVQKKRDDALKWMRGSKYACTTSFGTSDSRFDQWPGRRGNTAAVCRFSVGYDDNIENLKTEFDRLLAQL
jgi:cystathionine beta-lyase/cystathionine gamma-synthase